MVHNYCHGVSSFWAVLQGWTDEGRNWDDEIQMGPVVKMFGWVDILRRRIPRP